ncbi:jg23018 [Pararge aegeria aegeria]|uniref:Jg23018 protein n=1 Tax=Pararge aegeria aegeria TaxID=348720 RepID=A0A8S4SN38_9NEOP|nr:jg23018 [Pararge aegeria aegeria]
MLESEIIPVPTTIINVNMRTKSILTLLGVMAIMQAPCDANADQSDIDVAKNPPITGSDVGVRQRDAPEVVLQLKYNEGGLDKIYLTQFRKESKGWEPPVVARRSLCADLCYSGASPTERTWRGHDPQGDYVIRDRLATCVNLGITTSCLIAVIERLTPDTTQHKPFS